MRDKRIKGCPNYKCNRSKKKYKYKSTDMFCTICGEELVYVCAECFKRIEDSGSRHRHCSICEAKRKDKTDARMDRIKKAGAAVGAATLTAGGVILKLIKR